MPPKDKKMKDQVKWITQAIIDNAKLQNTNVQTMVYPENAPNDMLTNIRNEMKTLGWKVNKRGNKLIFTMAGENNG